MSESSEDRATLARMLAEAARPKAGAHVEPETLARYREGSLDAESEARVQDHLVYCRQCAAKLLDLEALSDPDPGPPPEAVDFEVAAAWRDLERRAGLGGGAGKPSGRGVWWRTVAAALAVATLGLSISTLHFRRQAGERGAGRAPQSNAPIVYFDGVTRSEPVEATPSVAAGVDFLVVFAPDEPNPRDEYRVRIESAERREVWRSEALVASEHGTLRIAVPGDFLTPGVYSIRFEGVDEGARVQLEDYRLAVRSAG